jgi:hypothetical protein
MSYHCLMHIINVNICATRAAAAEGSFRRLPRPVTMDYAF